MNANLTKGSVFKNLILFSLPFFLSYFLQTLYGLADLFIAGRYNGADVITAVSVGSQIMHMITVMIVGLAMGATVVISQAVGGGKKDLVAKGIGNTAVLFLSLSVILGIVLILLVNPIIKVMAVPVEAIEQTRLYLIICFIGVPLITAYNVISSVFRGLGDSKSPMYFIAVACVLNIVVDFILIGPMHMQAIGAALGTVVSQGFSVVVALIYIRKKGLGVQVSKNDFRPDRTVMSRMIRIGIPVSCQDGFIQISFLVITIIANGRGVEIAAAVGIVEKIICMLFLVPSSMLSSISAIAAQNVGAGLHDRAAKTLRYGIMVTVGVGLVFAVTIQFCAVQMVGWFTGDSVVAVFGGQYLRAYVSDCAIASIHFCFSGFFTAYGRSMLSFIHNVISVLVARIPLAYLATMLYPDNLFPMGLAAPIGSLLSVVICIIFYRVYFSKKDRIRSV